MNNSNHFWTEPRMTALATCWQAGETALTISHMLGCTRNAVIGKLYAMGLIGADPERSAKQARKKWREPAYRAKHLALLHSGESRARQAHVKRCSTIAQRIGRAKRIIDREALQP